jgi:hypothetical protein
VILRNAVFLATPLDGKSAPTRTSFWWHTMETRPSVFSEASRGGSNGSTSDSTCRSSDNRAANRSGRSTRCGILSKCTS